MFSGNWNWLLLLFPKFPKACKTISLHLSLDCKLPSRSRWLPLLRFDVFWCLFNYHSWPILISLTEVQSETAFKSYTISVLIYTGVRFKEWSFTLLSYRTPHVSSLDKKKYHGFTEWKYISQWTCSYTSPLLNIRKQITFVQCFWFTSYQ